MELPSLDGEAVISGRQIPLAVDGTSADGISIHDLVNAFPHSAIIADAKGRMLFVSDALATYSGKSVAALMAGEWLEIIHSEDQQQIARSWTRQTEKRESYEAEHRMRRADGEYRWFVASARCIRKNGSTRYWVATLIDIHDRRVAEAAQRQSQEDLDFVLRSGSIGTWRYDLVTQTVEASAQLKLNFGRDPTEPLDVEGVRSSIFVDDNKLIEEAVRASVEAHGEFEVTTRVNWPDGSLHWINCRGRPFYDDAGKLKLITGIAVDITRSRQQEQALAMTRDSLLIAEQAAGIGVWEWNLKTNAQWFSDGQLAIYGYPATPENRSSADILSRIHQVDRTMVEVLAQRAIKTGSFQSDHRIQIPVAEMGETGVRLRWVHSRARVMYDEKGEPVRMIGVDLDITDRKHAEESLRTAQANAQAASDAKDRFLAMLSHELRTPLNPALLAISSILKGDDLSLHVREDLEMARRNIELETHLIDDLLEVTRIIQGKLHIRREKVHLHELLQHAADICASQTNKRIQLIWHFDAVNDELVGDPARLQQVFWNILKNAYKFSDDGGIVTIRTSLIDMHLRVDITDNGIGIGKESLKRIFVPFAQGSTTISKVFGGLGLGLAIAKGVVELHQGGLHAYSEGLGRGATLTVELPTNLPLIVEAAANPNAASSIAPSAGAIADSPRRARRILLVEDHVDTAKTMSRVLKLLKCEVETASTVALALQQAVGDFDIVITDLGLPDGHGRDLIRTLRTRFPSRPVIALSGYAMAEDIQLSLAAGATAHLAKPINIDTLKQTLESLFGPLG